MLDVGILNILFDKTFLVTSFVGASSPSPPSSRWACRCWSATGWSDRLKSVARAARGIARPPSRGAERQARLAQGRAHQSCMKATLDRFKLSNMLESENQHATSWPRPAIAARRR